jgi:acetyltransferase-like isoleucine patch superfamily enzyme
MFARGLRLLARPGLVAWLGRRSAAIELLDRVRAECKGAVIDDDVILRGWAEGRVLVGELSRIEAGTVLALGDAMNGFGNVVIGRNTWVGEFNNLRAGGGDIVVGNDCLISQFCSLVASNHDTSGAAAMNERPPAQGPRGVRVGNDVWLGAGCTLLPGVQVGDGAVVGANSVVTRDVPAYEVWAGAPALKIRSRT